MGTHREAKEKGATRQQLLKPKALEKATLPRPTIASLQAEIRQLRAELLALQAKPASALAPPPVVAVRKHPLTPRLEKILQTFITCRDRKRTAKVLNIMPHTLDQQLRAIIANFSLNSTEDLIAWGHSGQHTKTSE